MSTPLDELLEEASRQFSVCNACRYCEDYCAVFPAMEQRRMFLEGDLAYLASVCHDCRACHQACMYTDPHPLALNLPELLSEARVATYEHYARPRWMARVLGRTLWGPAAATAVMLILIVVLIAGAGGLTHLFDRHVGAGAFYRVLPHVSMLVPPLVITVGVAIVAISGLVAFWRDTRGKATQLLNPRLWARALWEALALRWMRGGGDDCYFPDIEAPSPARRRLHILMVAGFLATFAATVSAFVYETFFDVLPPYHWLTLPVQLGLWGGAGVLVGAGGLTVLKRRNRRALTTAEMVAMDYTLLVSLELVAITGIALLLVRTTPLMGAVLAVHLATVLALLLAMPYGKFVHAVYRLGALLLSVRERDAEAAAR